MKKTIAYIKRQSVISFSIFIAIILIFASLMLFKRQINTYIEKDMHEQIDAIQKSTTHLVQNELNYLKRITMSAAGLMVEANIETDEDILRTLEEYAVNSKVVRALFVTLDGHAYTSYAGYLGQSDDNTALDGVSLAQIDEPFISKPIYAADLDEVIFGVVTPVVMGEKHGVLVSSYNISQMNTLLSNEFVGGMADIGITSSQGMVIVGNDTYEFDMDIFDGLSKVTFLSSSAKEMQQNFANGLPGFASYSVQGVERYCSYAPVELNDWVITVSVKEHVLRSSLSVLERYGFQLTVSLIIVMIVLFFVIGLVRHNEQKKLHQILRRAAMFDGLTGIYNRRTTEAEISKVLENPASADRSVMLMIDLDNFKEINDTYGHIFGDEVIRACALRLQNIFASEKIIGRFGGDEFVVLIENCSDMDGVYAKIDEFLSDFYVTTDGQEKVRISASVGVTQSRDSGSSFMTMYQSADKALYRAKQNGKNKAST